MKTGIRRSRMIVWLLAAVMVLTLAMPQLMASPFLSVMNQYGGAGVVYAAGNRVVTLGADLSEQQRASIFQFFGTSPEEVTVMIITNADEREHLGHLIPSEVIGWQTFSCAYVAPTDANGIQVKTANMNYVTGNMIASTLATSGVENCDVLAAAPFEVSGTGALTGVMMAYEQASGEELDPAKKELANEELVTTGEIANEIGQDEAILVVNDIKIRIIRDGASPEQVAQIVDEVVNTVKSASASSGAGELNISQNSVNLLYEFGEKIAEMGYDYSSMQYTLQRVAQNVTESTGIEDPIMDTFEEKISTKISEDSILYTADDSVFGGNTSSTFDDPAESVDVSFDSSLTGDQVSLTMRGAVNSDSWVSNTNVLYYRGNNGNGLMDVDGNVMTDAVYTDLYGENGYITAAIPNNTANCFGILNTSGEELTPFKYGKIDMENSHWAVCWELVSATEADYDAYDYDDNYYQISTADIYYLEDGTVRLAGTLSRNELGEYYANGKTINIENRGTGQVNCYNSDFEVVQTDLSSAYSIPDSSLLGEVHVYRANGQDGLLDADNNVIMPPAYYDIWLDMDRDYIMVSTGTYEGLIDWDGNEMIAPEYDEILSGYYAPMAEYDHSTDEYAGNGYVTALKNGNYVFLDVNGNVTYETSYADQGYDADVTGASVLLTDASGNVHILAADGVDTVVSGYHRIAPMNYGAGMLYQVQSEDYSYGVIDWHGNVLFDTVYDRVKLSANGQHLLVNEYYAGTTIYDVSYEGPEYVPVITERVDPRGEIEIRDEQLAGELITITGTGVSFDDTVNWVYDGNELHYYGESPLLDIEGNVLTSDSYTNFQEYYGQYIEVQQEKGGQVKYGLLNTEGDTLIPVEYDEVDMESSFWALAFVLQENGKDEGDFHNYSDDTYLDIVTADIYYLEDGTASLAASLSYDEISEYTSAGSGQYLAIADRQGIARAYDSNFEVVDDDMNSVYSTVDWAVYNYDTYRDNGQYGLTDASGNIIIPAAYSYIYVSEDRGYAELEYDDKTGAADLTGRILVPAEYDDIIDTYNLPIQKGKRSTSGIVANGYIPVVLNELVGYYDLNGNLSVEPFVDKESAEICGASLLYTGDDGKMHLLAGDGVDTVLPDDIERINALSYGAGMLYRVVNADYDYGLMDWHGNMLLPCKYSTLSLSANGRYLITNLDYNSPYEIMEVSYTGEGSADTGADDAEDVTDDGAQDDAAKNMTDDGADTAEDEIPTEEPVEETPVSAEDPFDAGGDDGFAGGDDGFAGGDDETPADTGEQADSANAVVIQILDGVKALAESDYEGNKENIALLLSQVSLQIQSSNPDVAALIDSTVQLIERDLADGETIGTLMDAIGAQLK